MEKTCCVLSAVDGPLTIDGRSVLDTSDSSLTISGQVAFFSVCDFADDYFEESVAGWSHSLNGMSCGDSLSFFENLKSEILERYYDDIDDVWVFSDRNNIEVVPWSSEEERWFEVDGVKVRCESDYKDVLSHCILLDEGLVGSDNFTAHDAIILIDRMADVARDHLDCVWFVKD